MFRKTSFILCFIFVFLLSLPNLVKASTTTKPSCINVFDKSLIEPDTPISKILSINIDAHPYDSYISHIYSSLSTIIKYEEDHPDISQFDRDELRVMFNLLVKALFLPVGPDLDDFISSPYSSSSEDVWKLLGSNKSKTMFNIALPTLEASSLNSLKRDFEVLPSIIKSSYNSYYNIYRYLTVVSKRLNTLDFNYRKDLTQKDIDSFTVDPSLSMQPYGNYYASLGEPPFVNDGPMLFNHPHLRWSIYILHKVRILSQVIKDYMFNRWNNSPILQNALPGFTRSTLLSYNVEYFIFFNFYSKIFNSIFDNLSTRWDIPSGMILEQLLHYPAIVNELSEAYEIIHSKNPELVTVSQNSDPIIPGIVTVLTLGVNIDKWMNILKYTSKLKPLQNIHLVKKDFTSIYKIISDINIASLLVEQRNIPKGLNETAVNLIISLNYWISSNKTSAVSIPPFKDFAWDYQFIFDQVSKLSNLNKAYVLWFIAFKAKKTMNDILISSDTFFLNWVMDITE